MIAVVLFAAATARAGSLGAALDRLIDDPAWRGATIGIDVRDAETGQRIFARDPAARVTPASTVKLITAVAAADTLSLDHRFETTVATTGPLAGGVLGGDLAIVGGGDPSLGWDDPAGLVRDWAAAAAKMGVRRIEGGVVADASAFGDPLLGSGWAWDDAPYAFSAPVSALNLHRNTMTVTARGAGTATVDAGALTPCLDAEVAVRVAAGSTGIAVQREPWLDRWRVMGQVPPGSAARATTPLEDPPRCAAAMLHAALLAEGIAVGRPPRVGSATPADVVAVHRSEPLADLLHVTLEHSQNLYAEAIARALDPAPVARTYAGASEVIAGVLRQAGIPDEAYRLVDGSGLSRYDLVSAETLANVALWARGQPWFEAVHGMLPVAGVTGTLDSRMTDGPAHGNVRGKTGSMSGVRNIVGYVTDAGGRELVVAVLITGFTQPQADAIALQDALLQRVAASRHGRLGRRQREALPAP